MDRIILSGVEFYAHGGVTEAEKAVGQRYRAHLELWLDLSLPAATDRVEDTVSYAEVFDLVVETARERPFNLLESVTGRVAERVLNRFPVRRVTVQLQKLLPPIDGTVAYAAIEVTRERDGA
jgi:dihydroneopterin aldolase